ncbi:GNAT family N-acetyltransferase [Frankia sp. CcI49]|uniref:GNAT family N-acetyltransferase n=1 Tax=Frankia sp. CcI49 TaxID=1745382 RepID=UPI00097854B8|nr:GNAT family N-acetyltransferase [Frankia sp. CcI49]ONH54598.1 GNAT family N-acetyltransferase [Frankia sp. CcI49]
MTLTLGQPNAQGVPTVLTPRLVLRGWHPDDVSAYFEIVSGEGMADHTPQPSTEAGAWSQTAFQIGHWALRGYGMWAVEDRGSGELLGRAGLYEALGWPGCEVAWTIRRERWGEGLATEAGAAALEFAFDAVDRDHIISIMTADNIGSIHVAGKLGLKYDRTQTLQGADYSIYAINRDDWAARRKASNPADTG